MRGERRSARPTIRDVAAAANVSLSTVSAAMNRNGRVDERTRERVLAAAQAIGWRPQRSARALRSGRTGIFALCLPALDMPVSDWLMNAEYDMAVVAACAAAAVDSGRQLLLSPRPANAGELARLEVDGVLLVDPQVDDPTMTLLREHGTPVVTIDRDPSHDDGWWAGVDTAAGLTEMCDHLVAQGATTVGLISRDDPWTWFIDSAQAYTAWCTRRGARPQYFTVGRDAARADAADLVARLAGEGRLPDGVVVVPPRAALGVLDGAARAGISVPGDLLLGSTFDAHGHEISAPSITSLDLRPADTARAAISLLITLTGGDPDAAAGPPRPRLLRPRLRVRESTRRAGA